MTDTVLFVGAGTMGAQMASRLADAGVPLAVADLSPAALEPFRRRGIACAATGADLPGDVVITMLPRSADVRAAMLGEGGAAAGVPRRALIDMSTGAPSQTRALAEELAARGIAMLDAPVSGGKTGAEAGTLTAMVGGEGELVERYRALLSRLCASVMHVGPIGAGQVVKALNNYLSGTALWATSEALLVGARAGLDPQTMIDTWKTSTGSTHALRTKFPAHVLPRTFDFGHSIEMYVKDLGIAAGLARELDVPAPALSFADECWRLAEAVLGAQTDFTSVITLLEQWSGYEVKG